MNAIRKQNRGFTLVEILIVVIILGILAAIVIPQFTNASEDARKSSLSSQVQSMKSQIALYKLQHRDTPPPTGADFWTQMTTKTDDAGGAYTAGTSTSGPFGPYFEAKVENPLNHLDVVGPAANDTTGWAYNPATGELHGVNKDGTLMTDDGSNAVVWNAAPAGN